MTAALMAPIRAESSMERVLFMVSIASFGGTAQNVRLGKAQMIYFVSFTAEA
jgi:hypothetical protein